MENTTTPIISIDEAKKLIETEKQERAKAFAEELKALCEKYKCELHASGVQIIPM